MSGSSCLGDWLPKEGVNAAVAGAWLATLARFQHDSTSLDLAFNARSTLPASCL